MAERVVDILGAGIGLLLLSPVVMVVARNALDASGALQ